jgi:hypothetical protein
MKNLQDKQKNHIQTTWEEESGLLSFLSSVPAEVDEFNRSLGFVIKFQVSPPVDIDGDQNKIKDIGFVIIRENWLLPERTYCMYALLEGKALRGYIGIYNDGHIKTYRELKPMADFKTALLYDWLRDFIRTSCEK